MRRRPPALRQPAIEACGEPGAAARLAVNRQALVRVFLVCDVRVHRDLLSAALAEEDGIELAGSAHGDVACLAVGMSEANVVLVDGGSVAGPATVRALAAAAPEAKIVVTGVPEDEGGVVSMVADALQLVHHVVEREQVAQVARDRGLGGDRDRDQPDRKSVV